MVVITCIGSLVAFCSVNLPDHSGGQWQNGKEMAAVSFCVLLCLGLLSRNLEMIARLVCDRRRVQLSQLLHCLHVLVHAQHTRGHSNTANTAGMAA